MRTEEILTELGFAEISSGVFLHGNESSKVVLSPDGLRGYSVGRGYVDQDEDYMEFYLNFIPGEHDGDDNFLKKLLSRSFYLDI